MENGLSFLEFNYMIMQSYDCLLYTSTALIEHTGINAQNICKIYGTVKRSFIRADDDQMILVDNQIPVSYTHLDVYKRQALTGCRNPERAS